MQSTFCWFFLLELVHQRYLKRSREFSTKFTQRLLFFKQSFHCSLIQAIFNTKSTYSQKSWKKPVFKILSVEEHFNYTICKKKLNKYRGSVTWQRGWSVWPGADWSRRGLRSGRVAHQAALPFHIFIPTAWILQAHKHACYSHKTTFCIDTNNKHAEVKHAII